MYKYIDVSGESVDSLINKYDFYVCKVRNSRIRAMDLSVKEVLFTLKDFQPVYLKNAPLSDVRGTFVVLLPKDTFVEKNVFDSIGYCDEFYALDFNNESKKSKTNVELTKNTTWKKRSFAIEALLIQDKEDYIQQGADKRPFKIIGQDGYAEGDKPLKH